MLAKSCSSREPSSSKGVGTETTMPRIASIPLSTGNSHSEVERLFGRRRRWADLVARSRCDHAYRNAPKKCVDVFDHIFKEDSVVLPRDVRRVGSEHDIGKLEQRMVRGERLFGEHIEAGPSDRSAPEGIDECGLIDDRSPRGVDEIGGRPHELELVF